MHANRTFTRRLALVLASAALSSAMLMTLSAAAQGRPCTPDRNGRMVCPPPDASCLQDRSGDVVCSTPGGGIALDRYGAAACGPGSCTQDALGELYCASEARGAASVDRDGKAVCSGSCIAAAAQACIKPKPAN